MRKQLGLLRSLAIYYGQPWKYGRLRTFYAQFVEPGALCFDIGAHVGNRLWIWSQLGARCVGIEPQPHCMALLKRWYGHRKNIALVEAAVGAEAGHQVLHLDPGNPTVTTLSEDWMAAMGEDSAFDRVQWGETLNVTVTTLDALIDAYGRPDFCKIDVEGYELEVLQGLSQPLASLSFEYMAAMPQSTAACVARLEELAAYRYNWSPGERHRLHSPRWLDAPELLDALPQLAATGASGDVYCVLRNE